jgi:transposase
VAEVRRLVLALTAPKERRSLHLGWSLWRRGHQAVAARCHTARNARDRDRPTASVAAAPAPSPAAANRDGALTAAEWEAVRALLPPQRPAVGRPRHDHRTVLSGIVWILRNQASWRAMPPTCGKWATAYKRYRLWQTTGLWQQIATVLGLDATTSTREVSL